MKILTQRVFTVRCAFIWALMALLALASHTTVKAQDIVIVRGSGPGQDFTLINGKEWLSTNSCINFQSPTPYAMTNGIDVPEGETWALVESRGDVELNGNLVYKTEKYVTSGVVNPSSTQSPPYWHIAGPGQLYLPVIRSGYSPGLVTTVFKRTYTKGAYPPDKSVIIPTGSGGRIGLEMSSDLINWQPTTLGSYTAPTNNLFFRLKLDRTP